MQTHLVLCLLVLGTFVASENTDCVTPENQYIPICFTSNNVGYPNVTQCQAYLIVILLRVLEKIKRRAMRDARPVPCDEVCRCVHPCPFASPSTTAAAAGSTTVVESSTAELTTEVVIVGNGPAALALSAFLSGITPRYTPTRPHFEAAIHERLAEGADLGLLEQDLSWVEACEEWNSRPLSSLYDSLVRPGADLGEEAASSLSFECRPGNVVPHVVLGANAIGGSWNEYSPEMLAVSIGTWLDLPGYGVEEWVESEFGHDQRFHDFKTFMSTIEGALDIIEEAKKLSVQQRAHGRLHASEIARYMQDYAAAIGIEKHFQSYVEVAKIKKVDDLWHVTAKNVRGAELHYAARHVVLACGKTRPRRLEVPGEAEATNIVYDVWGLQQRLDALHEIAADNNNQGEETCSECSEATSYRNRGVVVVGDGVSAADVVLAALNRGLEVTQVIRRTERQLRSTTMSRLSESQYPEYHRVFRLMTGAETSPLYRRHLGSSVVSITDSTVEVEQKGKLLEKYGLLAVCIGRLPNVDGLVEGATVPIGQYTSDDDATLHAVGALAGDHFVRFLVGGSLGVARDILRDHKERIEAENAAAAPAIRPSCWSLRGLMAIL